MNFLVLTLASTFLGALLSSLDASPPAFVPELPGECGPSDVGGSSSGTICGVTVIYCAGTHLSGDCEAPSPRCEHVNKVVTFNDATDPSIQLGQKVVDFKCDNCQ